MFIVYCIRLYFFNSFPLAAEVGECDLRVLGEVGGGVGEDEAAGFEDVAAVGGAVGAATRDYLDHLQLL